MLRRTRWGRSPLHIVTTILVALSLALSLSAFTNLRAQAGGGAYEEHDLVSDQHGVAGVTDKNLVNAWGIAFGPKTPVWVNNAGTGTSTVYDGNGNPFPIGTPLVVNIPAPKGSDEEHGDPTGIVFNTSTDDFAVSKGDLSAPSVFLFATENGTIAGWSPKVDVANAVIAVDNSDKMAIYKGLATGRHGGDDFLFATDFHNGKVDVFNSDFKWVSSFTDKHLPDGFAPFGIQNINGFLYVTFAQQDADKKDDVAGPGLGFVDVFTTGGQLVKRLISQGQLDAPWGLAWAPSDFGPFSNALLVGNFGNGRINAFDPHSGKFLGALSDKDGNAITIDGLWGLAFGNGMFGAETDHLFFTAGPDDEMHGLFGFIKFND